NYAFKVLPLLVRLHEKDALPAILFNYERYTCEQIAKFVLRVLETAEELFKSTNVKWNKTLKDYEQWRKAHEARSSRQRNHLKGRKMSKGRSEDVDGRSKDSEERHDSKLGAARDSADRESYKFESFDPNKP